MVAHSKMREASLLKCLAVIPARSGSKRIANKNTRLFYGKPLIAYTIEAAQASNIFDRIIVSTDSERIAEVARQFGAETPYLRDASLADDYAPVSLTTVDALNKLDSKGTRYQYVAQLMANCPLRTAANIVDSYRQFLELDADAQISVTRYGWLNPWWAMERNKEFVLQPLFTEQLKRRSQDLPELFCPTGAIWWAKAETLRQKQTFHIENRVGWEMPWQEAIDIDNEEEWQMAEFMVQLRLHQS